MRRKLLYILLAVSFVFTNIIAYLDYDSGNFEYLVDKWQLVIAMTLVFTILPFSLLFIFKRSKYKLYISLLGFTPALYLMFYLL